MLKVISFWSIQRGNERALDEVLDEVKSAGFDGIELAVAEDGPLRVDSSQADCQKIRQMADQRGLALQSVASGMSWGHSPTHLDPAVRKRSVELHRAALQRTAWLGAEAMLYVPGAVKIPWDAAYKPVPYDKAVQWAVEGITALKSTAEAVGVDLCVENVWNGLFLSPLELAATLDAAKSPRVGAYFDVGNVLGYHQYPPHWIDILGTRIKRIHIKDFKVAVGTLNGFCDLLDGDVPWKETMEAIRRIGYDKTITAEIMPPDDTLLKRTSKAMDQILGR